MLCEYRNMTFHVPQKCVNSYKAETELLSGCLDLGQKILLRPLIDT